MPRRSTLPIRALLGAALGLGITLSAGATGVPADGGVPNPERLALLGAPGEQVEWALRFEHGEGVAQDYDAAVRLYCEAAWQGHAQAQYALGWMYANGRGVARDDGLAAVWFGLAAEQGDAHARRMLAQVGAGGGDPRCVLPDGRTVGPLAARGAVADRATVERWVRVLAPEFALPPDLVLAVIQTESNFNPRARSPKNAQGLMQLIPATASRFGVEDVWDPVANLRGGMAYLRWLSDYFDGDLRRVLAGYNAGEHAVDRHGGIPPYAETRQYVRRILGMLGEQGARPPA
ncbi:MAG: transglycosylase SLT domain-containing protein [Ectothiorhodospiraceae bacterium]|nr:transglycosylase SLT domain-containing protein [Chromatiales bacterium]MCP5155424.1 transglycosylase SLT domain-containing protein [Ectothiorhodospiraceae bacterium]